MLAAPVMHSSPTKAGPRPFCGCWVKKTPVPWRKLDPCNCGEVTGAGCEWVWEEAEDSDSSLVLSDDKKQVTFHPSYSSGTAVVKGDMPFVHNVHYYWEVKVLTETYGTDIIIGVGTKNLDMNSAKYKFSSLLGSSEESYGLSYTGRLRHMDWEIRDAGGFCRGTIVGVRVDMWQGTLEFYLNRKPQGISFYNLRRHETLFPMISSTAAQSTMRLVYSGSYRSSLVVDSLKILAASANPLSRQRLPPGMMFASTTQFWLSLPTDGDGAENSGNAIVGKEAVKSSHLPTQSSEVARELAALTELLATMALGQLLPHPLHHMLELAPHLTANETVQVLRDCLWNYTRDHVPSPALFTCDASGLHWRDPSTCKPPSTYTDTLRIIIQKRIAKLGHLYPIMFLNLETDSN